jgi:hypothetical protein
MKFNDLWIIIIERNPLLQRHWDTPVTMPIKGFRKALKLAYDKGKAEGQVEARVESHIDDKSIWEQIFGHKG